MTIDPGNEFSKPKPTKLEWLLGYISRNPNCTLQSGEAKLLCDEISRLKTLLTLAEND